LSDLRDSEREGIGGFLSAVRGRYRLYGALTVLVVATAAAVTWVLGETIADRILILQMHHRIFLLRALEALVLGVGAAMVASCALRSRSRARVAAWVEGRYPHLKNGLITLVELWRKRDRKGQLDAEEAELARLIGRRVAEQVETLDAEEVIGLGELHTALRALAVIAAAGTLYAVFSWQTVTVSLSRVLFPWELTPPPTRTRIVEMVPGDGRALRNFPVTIRARMSGVVPGLAELHVSEDRRSWRSLPMEKTPGRWWEREVPGLNRATFYQVTAGDTRSDMYQITLVEPPLVGSVVVRVTPPGYSGLEGFTSGTGSVTALTGSRLEVVARTNKPPSRAPDGGPAASIVLKGAAAGGPGGRRVRLRLADGGPGPAGRAPPALAGEFLLCGDGTYRVEFTDESGYHNASPVEYALKALPDEPPSVKITSPGEEVELPPFGRLAFSADTADDLGLGRLLLSYQAGFEPWRTRVVQELRGRRSASVEGGLELRGLELAPGTTVTYFLSAEDARAPKPNTANSARQTVRIRAALAGEKPPAPDEKAGDDARAETDERDAGADGESDGEPRDAKALAEELARRGLDSEEVADALRRLARKLKEISEGPEGGEGGEGADAGEGSEGAAGDDAEFLDGLARALDRLADEFGEDGQAGEGGSDEAVGDRGDEYEDLDTGEEGGRAEGDRAEGAEGGEGGQAAQSGGGPRQAGSSGQAGQEGQSGQSGGGPAGQSGQAGGSGQGAQGGQGGQAGRSPGGMGSGSSSQAGSGRSGSGRGRGNGSGTGGSASSGPGSGVGGGGGSLSGGAARAGTRRGGEASGGVADAEGSAGPGLRRMAGDARQAAGRIRRGQQGDEEYARLGRLAEELRGFARRMKPPELERLRRLVAARRRPREAGEAADAHSRAEDPAEVAPSEGPLGPAGRAASRVDAAAGEDEREKEGRSPEDVSRLSPEFRRLYEAYTRSVSE